MRNNIIALIAALAVVVLALPALAEPDDPDHPTPPTVAVVYVGDVDRLAATALAEANTADGISTVAITPHFFDPTMAYGRFLHENVKCILAVGAPAANHPNISLQGIADHNGAGYVEAIGGDRFETAALAGERLSACDPN